MTLVAFEETLKTLFITPEGEKALESEDALKAFIEQAELSKEEQAFILSQSLERLEQYQYMLYANVKDTLEAIYPFCEEIIGDEWDELTKQYQRLHPPTNHHIINIGQMFPEFLAEQTHLLKRYPFLQELAAYEWVEAELLSAFDAEVPADITETAPQTSDDLKNQLPFINTTAHFLQLSYAVPDIIEFLKTDDIEDLPEELAAPQPKLMWIYRLKDPYHCRFFELTPPLAAWLAQVFDLQQFGELLAYEETLAPIYTEVAKSLPNLTREQFDAQFLTILSQLLENKILLGSLKLT